MSDIANHLGVSRLTVSAVLNNRIEQVGISERTAKLVRETAEQMGYHRNHLALATKTGRNPVVGCIISEIGQEWAGRMLSGFLAFMHSVGYLIKVEEVSGQEQERKALSRLLEQRVLGIFCCNFNPEKAFCEQLKREAEMYGTPVVSALSAAYLTGDRGETDDAHGIELAVEHLWNLGHRQFAFVGGYRAAGVRREAFSKAMAERKVKNWRECPLPTLDERELQQAMQSFLKPTTGKPVTGIVCGTDASAAVAVRVARSMGVRVPVDLSVVGFSDSRICPVIDPPLTSVRQPFDQLGSSCAQLIIDRFTEEKAGKRKGRARSIYIPTTLVVRGSTAPVPKLAGR